MDESQRLRAALKWAREIDCGCCSSGHSPKDPDLAKLIAEIDDELRKGPSVIS